MKNSREILSSLHQAAQMGQIGISCVRSSAVQAPLQTDLDAQMQEYGAIQARARCLAQQRGWKLSSVHPAVRPMARAMTRMRLTGKNTDSKIAGMMIQGNTRGMIASLQNLHRNPWQDREIRTLSEKMLETEIANIRQMQSYL